MRVLLDENIPVELAKDLTDHEVVHVKDLGWKGISNGELLRRADNSHFDALITGDSGLPNQQNLPRFEIAVIQLRPRRLVIDQVRAMAPAIDEAVRSASRGALIVIERPDEPAPAKRSIT